MNQERIDKYYKDLIETEKSKLKENSSLINHFKNLCLDKGIELTNDNFSYNQRIGIIASYPDLVLHLDSNLKIDKEGLFKYPFSENNYTTKKNASGLIYGKNYILLAHPYFRRGFNEHANYAPRFVDLFWGLKSTDVELSIALDLNRVSINIGDATYIERDTWYGAKFNKDISKISDGPAKLSPPLFLNDFEIKFFFNYAYSLNTIWNTKENIKVFQAEEFKNEEVYIEINNTKYYPARYIHAEFDFEKNMFRHFDGAIHLYTENEYYKRRDSDFNYNSKNDVQIKTSSTKLFKMNGNVSIDTWIEFSSHFFTGNPLIFEYFEGRYPEYVDEAIKKLERIR